MKAGLCYGLEAVYRAGYDCSSMLQLVIPTRNEAPYIQSAIRRLVRSLAEIKDDWQIIVADNGSTDGTGETVEELRIKNDELKETVQLLSCPKEGKGAAIRYATTQSYPVPRTSYFVSQTDELNNCTMVRPFANAVSLYDVRCTMYDDGFFGFIDADLSADPDAIPGMLEKLLADEADLVIGSRLLNVKTTNRGWLRTVASKLFNGLTALMLGLKVKDAQCGLKLMNARGVEVLKQCQEPGWFLDIELLARARQQGLRILEVPVVWTEFRFPGRKSQIRHIQDGLEAIRAMWRVRRRLHN